MKPKLLGAAFLTVLVGGLFIFSSDLDITSSDFSTLPAPCSEPLTYRIANIDSRYNLTEQKLQAIMLEVETLWESAMDQDLLNYESQGSVGIHIVYSEEQQHSEKEQQISTRIEQLDQQISAVEKQYQQLAKRYENKQNDLQEISSQYNSAIKDYNSTIEKWNKKGGIPVSKKSEIEKKQQHLDQLKSEVQRVNETTETIRRRVNTRSDRLQSLVEQQNNIITQYNYRFAEAREFNQGRYTKKGAQERINIFQFTNHAELKTVLAHEIGHAMGLGHVGNPQSVMHSMMGEQNIFNLNLSDEDISALNNRCGNEL